jgi:hypothetical protein
MGIAGVKMVPVVLPTSKMMRLIYFGQYTKEEELLKLFHVFFSEL